MVLVMSDEVYAMHCSLELVQSISTHQQTEAQNKKAVGTFQNKRWRPAQLIQYLRTQLPSIVTQEQIHMPSSKGCLKPQSHSRSEYQKAGKWNTTGSALLEVIKRDHSINNNFWILWYPPNSAAWGETFLKSVRQASSQTTGSEGECMLVCRKQFCFREAIVYTAFSSRGCYTLFKCPEILIKPQIDCLSPN